MQRYRHLLLLNTYCSQNRQASQTFYGRLLLLRESSLLNSCVGKCNMLSYYSISLS